MAGIGDDLEALTDEALADLIRAATTELTQRGTTEAFRTLIELSGQLGMAIGESARIVAERGSWSQVADVSGTTKQAAWSRWH
jgi:hypothetical protein